MQPKLVSCKLSGLARLLFAVIGWGSGAALWQAHADLFIGPACLADPPADVRVGQGVEVVDHGVRTALRFGEEGITVPLASSLTATAGTIRTRFQLPADWPSDTRGTLFHVGEQSHVHVTLMVSDGRLVAVYKGGKDFHAAISDREAGTWKAGSWHDVAFSWRADGQAVDFHLEVDDRLVGSQSGRLITEWPDRGYVGARRKGQAWQGTIAGVQLSKTFTPPRELRRGRRAIVIDGSRPVGACYNFWSINNYTSQHMFADPGYAARAKRDKPFMKSVNCVRLLGGRIDGRNAWFKGVADDGSVDCDFTGMIRYLRGIQDAGYTPRIVLDNIPTGMSEAGELATYGNTRPAKDLRIWHEYVRRAVTAMVDAFGADTVGRWRFRVGTEPDLNPGHWQGTPEEYLRHYDCTVDAVCSVLKDPEIGPGNILNPARADHPNMAGQLPWGLDIVDHCAEGTNTWTGAAGTRICFLECSWYGRVGRSIDSLDVAILRMRERLGRHPELADLPVSIAEFAVLHDENNRRLWGGDITEWGASWYAAIADRIYELEVRQVHEWAQTTSGILHPRARVMGMLEQMQGGRRLHVAVEGESFARAGAIGCEKNGSYYILLYNHRPARSPSVPEEIELALKLDPARAEDGWSLTEWGIDRDRGVFAHQLYADCEAAGIEPLPDSPIYGGNTALRFGPAVHQVLSRNRARYAELSRPVETRRAEPVAVSNRTVKLSLHLPGHSVRLLKISPR